MNIKEFKLLLDNSSELYGFEKYFGGWIKASTECIAVLELQKSKFGNFYYLNIKIYIKGLFKRNYMPSKELIKNPMGDLTSRETQLRNSTFNLDDPITDEQRKDDLEKILDTIIMPFVNQTSTRSGILELASQNKIFLLPAVKEELGVE